MNLSDVSEHPPAHTIHPQKSSHTEIAPKGRRLNQKTTQGTRVRGKKAGLVFNGFNGKLFISVPESDVGRKKLHRGISNAR